MRSASSWVVAGTLRRIFSTLRWADRSDRRRGEPEANGPRSSRPPNQPRAHARTRSSLTARIMQSSPRPSTSLRRYSWPGPYTTAESGSATISGRFSWRIATVVRGNAIRTQSSLVRRVACQSGWLGSKPELGQPHAVTDESELAGVRRHGHVCMLPSLGGFGRATLSAPKPNVWSKRSSVLMRLYQPAGHDRDARRPARRPGDSPRQS